jgi:hypothetical protein
MGRHQVGRHSSRDRPRYPSMEVDPGVNWGWGGGKSREVLRTDCSMFEYIANKHRAPRRKSHVRQA